MAFELFLFIAHELQLSITFARPHERYGSQGYAPLDGKPPGQLRQHGQIIQQSAPLEMLRHQIAENFSTFKGQGRVRR
jgi:hypothetical protein